MSIACMCLCPSLLMGREVEDAQLLRRLFPPVGVFESFFDSPTQETCGLCDEASSPYTVLVGFCAPCLSDLGLQTWVLANTMRQKLRGGGSV